MGERDSLVAISLCTSSVWFNLMSDCLHSALRPEKGRCSLVALHRKQIPSLLFHLGRCNTSAYNTQSPLISTKMALHPSGWPAILCLNASPMGDPSCLLSGKVPSNICFSDQPKMLSTKSMVCGQQKWLGRTVSGTLSWRCVLCTKPGRAQVKHWVLSFLSQETGTPSDQKESPTKWPLILCSASSKSFRAMWSRPVTRAPFLCHLHQV